MIWNRGFTNYLDADSGADYVLPIMPMRNTKRMSTNTLTEDLKDCAIEQNTSTVSSVSPLGTRTRCWLKVYYDLD